VTSPVQPPHPQLAVSAAIFRAGKILLVRRARLPAKGSYSLPGGRVEFGETLHAALHREVAEETALKIEILGTLHYLRGICGSNEGAKWRNEMQALIDAETPSGDRRARMIAGFNRGYNGFQQTYRSCTPAAAVAIRRYIEEGSKISRDLTARYAN
jgi:uncharacterized protein (TIGR02301 family)